jgi:uncharacterized protein
VRAALDPNVLISALLSPEGSPARTIRAWLQGEFELVVSPLLLAELARALGYPKLRKRIEPDQADRLVKWLAVTASMGSDPTKPPSVTSPDLGDDYLIALAESERAAIVSGDGHLLSLTGRLPVFSPAGFLDFLTEER